ncbi:MAG: hypothetical protein HUU50_00245 [Candidatus Brocadiae bacterium]|nr:hypothetical protein [Candidatus Brocadiia bacterium]
MSNLPENRKNLQQPGLLPQPSELPKKYPKIKEIVAPVGKSIPELLEESVAQQEPFISLVEQGEDDGYELRDGKLHALGTD